MRLKSSSSLFSVFKIEFYYSKHETWAYNVNKSLIHTNVKITIINNYKNIFLSFFMEKNRELSLMWVDSHSIKKDALHKLELRKIKQKYLLRHETKFEKSINYTKQQMDAMPVKTVKWKFPDKTYDWLK